MQALYKSYSEIMSYRFVQLGLRSFAFLTIGIVFFFCSEHGNLTSIGRFIMLGTYGSHCLITFGLLLEAGLNDVSQGKFAEMMFLLSAIFFIMLSSVIAFVEYYYAAQQKKVRRLNIYLVSTISFICYIIDIYLLCKSD